MSEPRRPTVLVVSGNDPSGGAGQAADVQAVTALGAHPAPVITSLTVQDTRNASRVEPVEAELVAAQIQAVLDDQSVAAVKIGLLASAGIARSVASVLAGIEPRIPVVLDPVLVAAGGAVLAERDLAGVLLDSLMPIATVVTPNAHEIRELAGDDGGRDEQARRLLRHGARFVLAKGGDEETADVVNTLYGASGEERTWRWPRLDGEFHGSGCTLASAIAARLAHGRSPEAAVDEAQVWTQAALAAAFRPGRGQRVPLRTASPDA
jgi:hydroxymethylpyrimidine/phosphomethylpyrimidine kinase